MYNLAIRYLRRDPRLYIAKRDKNGDRPHVSHLTLTLSNGWVNRIMPVRVF